MKKKITRLEKYISVLKANKSTLNIIWDHAKTATMNAGKEFKIPTYYQSNPYHRLVVLKFREAKLYSNKTSACDIFHSIINRYAELNQFKHL